MSVLSTKQVCVCGHPPYDHGMDVGWCGMCPFPGPAQHAYREAAPSNEQIVRVLDDALRALWRQHEALQRLAAHYPEASHVLSSPRKPEAIVIIERLRHWIGDEVAE
jgi:hypothetical protein